MQILTSNRVIPATDRRNCRHLLGVLVEGFDLVYGTTRGSNRRAGIGKPISRAFSSSLPPFPAISRPPPATIMFLVASRSGLHRCAAVSPAGTNQIRQPITAPLFVLAAAVADVVGVAAGHHRARRRRAVRSAPVRRPVVAGVAAGDCFFPKGDEGCGWRRERRFSILVINEK